MVRSFHDTSTTYKLHKGVCLFTGVKIAIGGKGGVGKTTVCAVLAQLFAQDGLDVIAVDADPDTNLCNAFGIPYEQSPKPLIEMTSLIAERTGTGRDATGAYFKLNPEVSDLPDEYCVEAGDDNLKLLVLGGIKTAGKGCACSAGAFLKALLSHTILHRQEVIFVDLDAGVECMGRASILGIDVLVIVVEPGSRSIETALNITQMAKQLGVKYIAAIINKVTNADQFEEVKSQLKDLPILADIGYSNEIQQADLQRKSAYQACPELVEKLRGAKGALTDMLEVNDE
ncbi:MAG: AAA family ATPase [Planctomycetes bacterium]|nr:AAA family ATPase [Planctomycetota bacterium]